MNRSPSCGPHKLLILKLLLSYALVTVTVTTLWEAASLPSLLLLLATYPMALPWWLSVQLAALQSALKTTQLCIFSN